MALYPTFINQRPYTSPQKTQKTTYIVLLYKVTYRSVFGGNETHGRITQQEMLS